MADTSKTRTQLIQRSAKLLALIEPGEAPSAEDYAALDGLVDPLVEQLSADGIYYVSDPEEIELKVFEPLARLLANIAGPEFGTAINEQAQARDERTLRRLSASQPSYETLKTVYY